MEKTHDRYECFTFLTIVFLSSADQGLLENPFFSSLATQLLAYGDFLCFLSYRSFPSKQQPIKVLKNSDLISLIYQGIKATTIN